MKLVRYIAFFLCCAIAVRSHGQIEINKLIAVEFYDSAFSAKAANIAYFKLYMVEIDGTVFTDSRDLPENHKEKVSILDSIGRAAKRINALKEATDNIILTVDKRFESVDDGNFQYRVKEDDSVLADWKQIDFSELNKVHNDDYMLVKGLSRNHKYIIDIRTKEGKNFGQVTYYNYPVPGVWGVFFPEQRDQLYQVTKYGTADSFNYQTLPKVPWEKYDNKGDYDTVGGMPSFITHLLKVQDLSGKNMDSFRRHANVIPANLNIPDEHNDLLFLMTPISDTSSYEYCLVNDKDTKDTILKWRENTAGNAIVELKDLDAGHYRLLVRYSYADSHSCVYYFTLRTHHLRSFLFGFLVGIAISILPVIAFKYVRRQKRKNKELQHKMTALQLQSYRAQLNPHFIFNALNSIQSLVNRDDKEQANKYLIDFSTLLRATLDQQSELWTLHDETDLLQKYIRLEQLRFRFHFELEVDRSIAGGNVDFPSMLLQPIVENAIKHGISSRQEEGKLSIQIAAKTDDLIITITDNGKGFDAQDIKGGSKGIALTKERIALLNEQNKERTIKLDISSNSQGTTATFYLYHYLHNG